MTGRLGLLLLGVLVAVPGLSRGEDRPEFKPGSFFFRFAYGAAYGSGPAYYDEEEKLNVRGPGTSTDIALGITLNSRVAIHGEYFGALLPNVEDRDHDYHFRKTAPTLDADGFGVGMTYRFPKSGVFASAAVGGCFVNYKLDFSVADFELTHLAHSDLGWAATALVGWEWRIATRWRAGLSAQLASFRAELPRYDWADETDQLNVLAGALLLSATYW